MPPKEQILDFLDKNGLKVKELREITGRGDQTIRDWLDWLKGNEKKSKFPKETWLLLNALFNRESSVVTDIIREYSKGDAFVENPELMRGFHDKVQVMKDTVESWNEMNTMERHEREVERINIEHIQNAMREYYVRRGTGPKVEKYEAYKQISDIEKTLGLPRAIAIQQFEELSKEFKSKGLNGNSRRFIENLLKIYDEYFEQLQEADLMKYLDNLGVAMNDWGERKSTGDIKNLIEIKDRKGKVIARFLANTPEQGEKIRDFEKKKYAFDNFLRKLDDMEYKDEFLDGNEDED